jgi:hypothetical protein
MEPRILTAAIDPTGMIGSPSSVVVGSASLVGLSAASPTSLTSAQHSAPFIQQQLHEASSPWSPSENVTGQALEAASMAPLSPTYFPPQSETSEGASMMAFDPQTSYYGASGPACFVGPTYFENPVAYERQDLGVPQLLEPPLSPAVLTTPYYPTSEFMALSAEELAQHTALQAQYGRSQAMYAVPQAGLDSLAPAASPTYEESVTVTSSNTLYGNPQGGGDTNSGIAYAFGMQPYASL